jgi:hypothetical protein
MEHGLEMSSTLDNNGIWSQTFAEGYNGIIGRQTGNPEGVSRMDYYIFRVVFQSSVLHSLKIQHLIVEQSSILHSKCKS